MCRVGGVGQCSSAHTYSQDNGVPRRRGAREVRTNLHAVLLLQDVVQQRRLPRPQVPRHDRNRDRRELRRGRGCEGRHWARRGTATEQ